MRLASYVFRLCHRPPVGDLFFKSSDRLTQKHKRFLFAVRQILLRLMCVLVVIEAAPIQVESCAYRASVQARGIFVAFIAYGIVTKGHRQCFLY